MPSLHRRITSRERKLSVRAVRAMLAQEALAWRIARSLRWGCDKRPLCPRCKRVTLADDSRRGRKRWECQNCLRNAHHRKTTKFSDATGTPFNGSAQSLALTFLCFAFGLSALLTIRRAGLSPEVIPTALILSEDHWPDKSLFRALKEVSRRIHDKGYDLQTWIQDFEHRQGQEAAKRKQAILEKYQAQFDSLVHQAKTLRLRMREELRSLRPDRPHRHLRKAA